MGAAGALLAACSGSQLPGVTLPSGTAPFAFTQHMTFRYAGKKQTFTVPNGVTRIQVLAVGGDGAGRLVAHSGRVRAVIPVTPSETLAIYVGGAGKSSAGGFNGGGAGGPGISRYILAGYGGGGASDVREGGDVLTDRVVVAGGAGGQGRAPSNYPKRDGGRGGQGGARTGGSGKAGCCSQYGNGGTGGTGGTQYQGGSGGEGGGWPGQDGALGDGGDGGRGACTSSTCGYGGSGGGGGGGYYGGGGASGGSSYNSGASGGGGGGGGGSSYVERTASDVHMWQGWKNADRDGLVVVSW
jgi:hypothetical protein